MRGGYRKNAGRKGEWKTGKTKAVKLPEKLLPKIVTLAKALDEGYEVKILDPNNLVTESKDNNFDLVTKSKLDSIKSQLKEIEQKIENQETGFKSNSFGKGIKQLKELFSQLNDI